MKIVFYSPGKNSQPWLDSLTAAMPAAEVWEWTPQSSARQADYAICWSPPPEMFENQRQLKAIFNIGAGADRVMSIPGIEGIMKSTPVIRLNDAGMAVQMAEYVCHALIRHARGFDVYESQQRQGEWKTLPPIDRTAWPVGVMGLGSIGARVAQSVSGFEFPTFGWSRTPKAIAGIHVFSGADALEEFLSHVRVLVCVLPLTPETRGILNARTLSKLKAGGYLVNVARGAHLVESDLLALLDAGTLAGATLDVFDPEPLPPDHAFWRHPKIMITPHISAITMREESVAQIAAKIRAMETGQEVDGVVRGNLGY